MSTGKDEGGNSNQKATETGPQERQGEDEARHSLHPAQGATLHHPVTPVPVLIPLTHVHAHWDPILL